MLIFVSPVIVFRQHASSWNVYDEAGARGLVIFGLGKSSRPTTAAPGVAGLHGTVHQKWQKSAFCRDLKILSERSTLKVGLRKEEKKPKKYIIFRIGSERNRLLLISN